MLAFKLARAQTQRAGGALAPPWGNIPSFFQGVKDSARTKECVQKDAMGRESGAERFAGNGTPTNYAGDHDVKPFLRPPRFPSIVLFSLFGRSKALLEVTICVLIQSLNENIPKYFPNISCKIIIEK